MVRIIAGTFRSRSIKTLEGQATRPTSDRLKETLFNVLQSRIRGSSFLDCFAGSGNIGIEAVSRGASSLVFIESSEKACRIIRENLDTLGLADSPSIQLFHCAVEAGLKILRQEGRKFDIVFLDPPYREVAQYGRVFQRLTEYGLISQEGLAIAEHSKHEIPEWESSGLEHFREVRQGDSVLSFLRVL
jgi:16S rRNA (guanine966-N2)-methyltransferase